MAESLVSGIVNLLFEFPAHTLRFFRALQPAGTVAARLLQPFADSIDNLLVGIE